eukprot:Nitzschia sp. Nitz4//scaffold32_size149145//103969//107607//NITZ4_002893-RA/size149145-augustus-gene-0.52-mRNA-1//-1//CDS//3329548111//8411//frame0
MAPDAKGTERDDEDSLSAQSPGGSNEDSSGNSSAHSKGSSSGESRPVSTDRDDINIGKSENRAVFRIRVSVVIFLVLCCLGAALMVYKSSRNQQLEEFEAGTFDFAVKVFGSLATSFDQSFAAMDALSVAAVSIAELGNMTWPFVTIPDSATRLAKVRHVSRATSVTIMPYVSNENLDAWNEYSLAHCAVWIEDNLRVQANYPGYYGVVADKYEKSPLWYLEGEFVPDNHSYYYPYWQHFPTVNWPAPLFNYDYVGPTELDGSEFGPNNENIKDMNRGQAQLSDVINKNGGYTGLLTIYVGGVFDATEPVSEIHYPIFEAASKDISIQDSISDDEMVGFIMATFYWRNVMVDMLPAGVNGLVLVVSTTCGSTFTYMINGPDVEFMGVGDHHNHAYDHLMVEASFSELSDYKSGQSVYSGLGISDQTCTYNFRVYPSATFERVYVDNKPRLYTWITLSIFAFTSLVFGLYDWIVEKRQRRVLSAAVRSSAIVSSLFPKNVRDRLMECEVQSSNIGASQKHRLKTFMSNDATHNANESSNDDMGNRPIADLFPEATVLFADIAGFTAWSSTREPSQVFILLETLYGSFDKLAAKRGVFKVETIGDCYMAVTGLPDPRRDHAVAMVKFARDSAVQLQKLLAQLSITLGPETEDMAMRFGMHSGPVTAGVLRGQKSRFQLFGDTVNTASRMESTGQKNRIQVSQTTADELINHGKSHWLQAREDQVQVKGKGLMSTYWIRPQEAPSSSNENKRGSVVLPPNSLDHTHDHGPEECDEKMARLIDWNVDVLAQLLQSVVSTRALIENGVVPSQRYNWPGVSVNPIEEVQETIDLPPFYYKLVGVHPNPGELDPTVKALLHDYVEAVARTYHKENPFHNFEHASHVCMSVAKLMSRIVAVDEFYEQHGSEDVSVEKFKHDQTFGIASDPLTLFACTFAALIHDADHPGVPNSTLVREENEFAQKYENRSVAEQRSVDIAWDLLMLDKFSDLRNTICPTRQELRRFRQLVVNSVMATDIMDKELIQMRNKKWDAAFDAAACDSCRSNINRLATIVIEHLIQASDVAHTMQHWQVYRKWNERFFQEMTQAYIDGRSDKDPAEFWYKGELGFFDFYIIPLAKKLSDCGVFGVFSGEYLDYAQMNREEWAQKGEAIVAEMVEKRNLSG